MTTHARAVPWLSASRSSAAATAVIGVLAVIGTLAFSSILPPILMHAAVNLVALIY